MVEQVLSWIDSKTVEKNFPHSNWLTTNDSVKP
jgi:hypothetical protein